VTNTAGTTTNIGTINGGATISGGTLQLGNGGANGSILGSVADNGTFAVNRSDVFTFGGAISGSGAFQQNGSGTTILTAMNTYGGATTVNAGTLMVNGSIAPSSGVTVNSGGTLSGTGTVASTVVASGGRLAPGNGNVGTLNVSGNLTFNSGSIFLVDVTPTTASRALVTGTAALAGTVEAIFLPGSYLANSYTILSATGGRTGTFDALATVNLPGFLTASVSYSPTDVLLMTLRSQLILSRPSLTANQFAVAATLDNSFNTGHGTLTGLFSVAPGQIPAALNALSGEGTSGTQETAFGAGDLFLTAMMEQGAFWRTGEGIDTNGTTYGPTSYGPDAAQAAVFKAMPVNALPANEPRYRAWFAGFDGTWRLDGQAIPGSASLTHSTGGGAAGLDYQINPNWLVGVAAGGSLSAFSVPDRVTSGTLDGAHIGAYGVARWGSWYAAGALAFNAFDNRTSRTIAGIGPTEMATGSFDSDMLSGRFEAGFKQPFNGFAVTPFAALQFAELRQSGYSESSVTGAGAPGVLGLTYASQTVSSLPTFLGAQFDTRAAFANGMTWSPYARVSWVHEFEPARDVTASFISLPVTGFTADAPRAANDAVRIDVGSKLAISRNTWLFASFDGEFSDRSQMYAGKGGFKFTW
jgi:outer membrane autotransporter protein